MDGHNDREADGTVAFPSFALHKAGKLILIAAGHSHLHCSHVHIVGRGDGFLDFGNLLIALDAALLDAGHNEFVRRIVEHSPVVDAEQEAELVGDVGAIGWEVFY